MDCDMPVLDSYEPTSLTRKPMRAQQARRGLFPIPVQAGTHAHAEALKLSVEHILRQASVAHSSNAW